MTEYEMTEAGVNPQLAKTVQNPNAIGSNYDLFVGSVDWDYFIPSNVTNIIPLFAQNADAYVRWIRDGNTEYVRLNHDDVYWTLISYTEQGLLASVYEQYWSHCDSDNEEDNKRNEMCFADAIGFKYRDKANAILSTKNHYKYYEKWCLNLGERT